VKRGVEPQARDHGDPWSHVVEQIDRGEAGVAYANDGAVWQPTRRLNEDLAPPIGKLLIPSLSLLVLLPIALRWGQDSQKRQSLVWHNTGCAGGTLASLAQ